MSSANPIFQKNSPLKPAFQSSQQDGNLAPVIDGIVNEYNSYRKEKDTLAYFYQMETIKNSMLPRGQDIQSMELYLKEEKTRIENKIYNLVRIFSESCQYSRSIYTQNLDEQLATYRANIQRVQHEILDDMRYQPNVMIPDCTDPNAVRQQINNDPEAAKTLLEQIFQAKRQVEKQKRLAWVLHKVAKKLNKFTTQRQSLMEEKVWKECEVSLRVYLDKFFKDLSLKEAKTFDDYLQRAADHFSLTQPNFFTIQTPFLHYFEPGSMNLYRIDIKGLKSDIPAKLVPIELDLEHKVPDWHGSIATPDGRIFVIGGSDIINQNKSSQKTYQFREDIRGFVRKSNMVQPREAFSLCITNGVIYVIGGISAGKGVIADCESYDIESDVWRSIAPLNKKCCQAAVCTFKNKYIYKFGGLEDRKQGGASYNDNIEKYSIRENVWIVLRPKIKDFILSGAVAINNNQIFVFGGVTSNQEKLNDSFVVNCDKDVEPTGGYLTSERIIAINQKPLPLKEGFWNGQVIHHDGSLYALQNDQLGQFSYGSSVSSRKILRFGGGEWKVLN